MLILVVSLMLLSIIPLGVGYKKLQAIRIAAYEALHLVLSLSYDLTHTITYLINTLKDYCKHDNQLLDEAVHYKNMLLFATKKGDIADIFLAEEKLREILLELMSSREAYPYIHSDDFQCLYQQYLSIQKKILLTREDYTNKAILFNCKVEKLSYRVVVIFFSFKPLPLPIDNNKATNV